MIFAKNLDVFQSEYDFTDSIVIDVRWDSNLLDLLITIDYYWSDQEENKELIIRFKDCRESIIKMPECYDDISEDERKSYILSWYTITNCLVAIQESELFSIEIKTVDDNQNWLTVVCGGIQLEQSVHE